jgi:carbonyl reductase 1
MPCQAFTRIEQCPPFFTVKSIFTTNMVVESRVAAVTGANKGIGLAIVRQLALTYPKSPLRSGPLLIYLLARSPERGAEAVQTLGQDGQLKKAKVLAEDGGETTIKYRAFDVSDSSSIREFRSFLQKQHPDGVDFVINNAGINTCELLEDTELI